MIAPSKSAKAGVVVASLALMSFLGLLEGNNPAVYADKLAYNVPTVCNGHTGPEVKVGDVWTKAQCDAILIQDIEKHGEGLLSCITVPINQNQYEALTAWSFNVGVGAACGSTLVKLLNQAQYASACNQLLRWDRAGGVVVRGLHNRRVAERELCLKPVLVEKAIA
ncbi:MAG: lysozyme [Rhodoferax sp.]|uniref:lysozyme n=1 Tax=Rhodoferax sp. TaxID=50421 RepID=UPI0018165E3C|nr:lysozyme [Rhodoferax sp.]NMM21860.1 lysozyme [Rhodoferax sp.]